MSRSSPTPYSTPPPRARSPRPETQGPTFNPAMHQSPSLGKWAEALSPEHCRELNRLARSCQCEVCQKAARGGFRETGVGSSETR